MTYRLLSEIGNWHFWLNFIGVNPHVHADALVGFLLNAAFIRMMRGRAGKSSIR